MSFMDKDRSGNVYVLPKDQATYILRYYLPVEPYADAATTARRCGELIAYCRRNDISAVMFYVAFRPDWYYMPDGNAHTAQWVQSMRPMIQKVREAGVSYQLNYQNLLGSTPGGQDFRPQYDWEFLVDHKGHENPGCACPLGERFRSCMGEQLRLWAETEPDVLWIDDDFRMHNHGASSYYTLTGEEPGYYNDWFCFCERHIALFNERYGHSFTREEIVSGALAAGKPSSLRRGWLSFMGETMAESARWIRSIVHSVSPNTRLAQMTSIPDVHAAEGRNWGDFLHGLTGDGSKALIRPHFGPYTEAESVDFIRCFLIPEQTRENIRLQYGEADFCPELENTRFTAWSKSVRATKFQLLLSQLLGFPGITLSLHDLEGTPLSEEPDYAGMLHDAKPALDRLASLRLGDWKREGAAFVTDPEAAAKYELSAASATLDSIAGSGRTFDYVLTRMGIPMQFCGADQAAQAPVAVIDGYTVFGFDDAQIRRLLAGGVLLDGAAAQVLVKRGYGAYLGIVSAEESDCITSGEVFHTIHHADGSEKRMPNRLPAAHWKRLKIANGAETLSTLVACSGERHPGLVYFENSLGGRVAVYAAHGTVGYGFFNHARAQQMRELMVRLSNGKVAALVETDRAALSLCKSCKDRLLVAFASLSSDGGECASIRIFSERPIGSVQLMNPEGIFSESEALSFAPHPDGGYTVTLQKPFALFDWNILMLSYAS